MFAIRPIVEECGIVEEHPAIGVTRTMTNNDARRSYEAQANGRRFFGGASLRINRISIDSITMSENRLGVRDVQTGRCAIIANIY